MRSVVWVVLLLAGCDMPPHGPITNDQIIEETHKCESAGLRAEMIQNIYFEPLRIRCMPREKP